MDRSILFISRPGLNSTSPWSWMVLGSLNPVGSNLEGKTVFEKIALIGHNPGSTSDIRNKESKQYVDENKPTHFPRNNEHSNKSDCLISIENEEQM